jgi:hypothetical protein
MYEADLWISCNTGGEYAHSVMHYDMNEGMMCLFSGERVELLE